MFHKIAQESMSSSRSGGSGGVASNLNSESSTGVNLSSTLSKALSSRSTWPDKEEFLDVIYWFRQIVGVILGLLWGVLAIQVCHLTETLFEGI